MGAVAQPVSEPEPQPTCGHESAGAEDVETIVAGTENQDSEQSSLDKSSNNASTPSLKAPCAIDCCSLAWTSFKRPNRDLRGMVPRKGGTHRFTTTFKPQMSPVLMVAPERFDKTIPRGPPATL
jgi:hypothetical protein